uniref:Serpin domain-containing protein n=1 Tax=Tetranychus urticae TaxID=32264 RepID=T1KFY0_TETUR
MSKLSQSSIDFGLNFLKQNSSSQCDSTNVILSPLSVIIAYCMALDGAAGETEQQIKKVFNLDKINGQSEDISGLIKQVMNNRFFRLPTQESIRDSRSVFSLTDFGSYRIPATSRSSQEPILKFGNLLMANKDYKFQEAYVQSLKTNYFADAFNEDYKEGQKIVEKVNLWVSKNTKNKITSILDEPPSPVDVLFLVNTIYFEGKWLEPFPQHRTRDDIFNNSDGTKIKTKMMTLKFQDFNYVDRLDKQLKIVELPYVGNISMILILPTEDNNLKKVIDNLDSTELSSLMESMSMTNLDTLTIPKFKLEDKHELHNILPRMGMTRPFEMNAEFPRIIEEPRPLYITKSIQKAVIEVFEKGTIASAATVVGPMRTMASAPQRPLIEFIADRPFMFFIRDNKSGVNLFMGQLNNMTRQQFL